ncbi:MAG: peptidylprolyl isomerase [Proteobacteria bacterium]|nr:peptidylprolyl isomerase [Pseudomonadota bacterium]
MNVIMYLKTGALMLGAVSVLTLTACDAAKTSAPAKPATPAKPGVAATVNGTAISDSRVDLMLKQSAAQGQPVSPELRANIIDNLALQMIVAKEATKKGLDKPAEVADQLDLAKQSILARAFIQDYFKKNPVDEKALTAEYEKVKASVSATEYKARHILVKQESEAKDIIAKLNKNPKAFEALAKEKSMDPGSKDNGGDLGWFDPQGMVPEFGAAVAKLEKGKFSEEPVKTNFGYHVIWLEDSRQKQFPPLAEVKPMLEQQLQQQNLKKLLDEMKSKAKIVISKPAAPAGAAAEAPKTEEKPAAK